MLSEESLRRIHKKLDWQVVILIIAIVIRIFYLGIRPAHHDEGVNGWFTDHLIQDGFYKYDPSNYHGPLHFYLLLIFQTLLGRSNWVIRMPTVIVSIFSIYWIFLYSRFLGRRTCLIAALALAISPGYIYYSRYVTFDMFLTFFSMIAIWGIIGLWTEGKKHYLWSLALGITGMILTKETYIIHLISYILSFIVLFILDKIFPSEKIQIARQQWSRHDLFWVLFTCIFLIVFFYSGTFYNLKDITKIFDTFKIWAQTGTKHHAKPYYYWFDLFFRYEQINLLGVISCIYCLKFITNKWVRYIALYGLGILAAHTIIPYKTPWLIVTMQWPFYLVIGTIADKFLETRFRSITTSVLSILFIISAFIAVRVNFIEYDNNKMLYAYVHTFSDINKFINPIFKLVKEDRSQYNMKGVILRSSEWPLPWILGDFPRVGYHNIKNQPAKPDADFLFVQQGLVEDVEERLEGKYFTETIKMRDSQESSKIYLSYEQFGHLFPGRKPEFVPKEQKPLEPGQGIVAIFYSNPKWEGSPVLRKFVKNINFYWEGDNRMFSEPFSAEFIGDINIKSNNYKLSLTTDDGGSVELDGEKIIDDPGPHAINSKTAKISGKAGWHKIKVRYYDQGGGAVVKLTKEIDSVETIVSPDELRYDEGLLKQ